MLLVGDHRFVSSYISDDKGIIFEAVAKMCVDELQNIMFWFDLCIEDIALHDREPDADKSGGFRYRQRCF